LAGPLDAPEDCARWSRLILERMARSADPGLRAALAPLLGKLLDGCRDRDQVDLLKHPCCVGGAEEVVRAALGRRHGQAFDSPWQLVGWLHDHRPDLGGAR
jgi:hypothetical protein